MFYFFVYTHKFYLIPYRLSQAPCMSPATKNEKDLEAHKKCKIHNKLLVHATGTEAYNMAQRVVKMGTFGIVSKC